MEYNSGHIQGALLMDVNNGQFNSQISQLDTSKTYLVYCRSGARSMNAARKMQSKGLKVINLQSGILGWDGELVQ
jgi:rhodanese-related sulfurtransferase